MALALVLVASLPALEANNPAEARANHAQWEASERQYYAPVIQNCPTNGARRFASFGNSWVEGYTCTTGKIGDGWRAALSRRLYRRGKTIQWVGTRTTTYNIVLGCPKTDGLSGAENPAIYTSLDAIPTVLPTPTSNDWILVGPALANLPGKSYATCLAEGKADLTKTAGLKVDANVAMLTDLTRDDGVDMTNYFNGMKDASDWGNANGYPNTFISLSSVALVAGVDRCPDLLHLTDSGNDKVAAAIDAKLP